MSKYIDTDKIIAFLNKKSKMVDPYKYPVDHIDLMALLAREYQSLILRVASFHQEQEKEASARIWNSFLSVKGTKLIMTVE